MASSRGAIDGNGVFCQEIISVLNAGVALPLWEGKGQKAIYNCFNQDTGQNNCHFISTATVEAIKNTQAN